MEYKLLIKQFRKKARLTQSQLAKKCNMNQSYLSELESNKPNAKSPTLRMIFNIAAALEVCPHVLIEYERPCTIDCIHTCPNIP